MAPAVLNLNKYAGKDNMLIEYCKVLHNLHFIGFFKNMFIPASKQLLDNNLWPSVLMYPLYIFSSTGM